MSAEFKAVEINPKTGRRRTFPSPQPRKAFGRAEAEEALARIANNESLRKTAKALNWDDITLWRALTREHSEAYALAREIRAMHSADKVQALTEALIAGKMDPDIARVAGGFLMWLAERQDGRRWSQSQEKYEAPAQQAVSLQALAAQLAGIEAQTGLFARLGVKIETQTVTIGAEVEKAAAPQLPEK